MKKLLRPDEAAHLLGVSRWTIYRWVDEGRLRAAKVGPRSLRVLSESVEELIERNATGRRATASGIVKLQGQAC
ncbi:helix-turn-helix transcriptional regulator [Candidatus Methylacidithermus pantelleriae]|uniref:Helix-turn-helix domain-containing protein n=1 Tax=Candidatus Methylacidithermus pantelleriae TaxID=2744239 RepID=A0A8J2BPF6_9BACT|nr:helix-turn-helix domain-containing protein [Candidatus Methylacidithermus pantelleriae]CAF0700969.1 hypothetical protein MPNT_40093 [Candidatus Methylacidithermus pantelleriae]